MTDNLQIFLADEAATIDFGARLAATLEGGKLVALSGPLGSGKSALARALIRAELGDPELIVPSPSFALAQPYQGPSRAIIHADLYRLSSDDEVFELGLFEDVDALVLVEWPERSETIMAQADLLIALDIKGDGRMAHVTSPAGSFDLSRIDAQNAGHKG